VQRGERDGTSLGGNSRQNQTGHLPGPCAGVVGSRHRLLAVEPAACQVARKRHGGDSQQPRRGWSVRLGTREGKRHQGQVLSRCGWSGTFQFQDTIARGPAGGSPSRRLWGTGPALRANDHSGKEHSV